MGSWEASTAAFPPCQRRLRKAGVVHLGFGDESRRQGVRRFFAHQSAYYGVIRTQPFAHAFQRERESQLFEFRINRHLCIEIALNVRQLGIGKFPQPICIRLQTFIACPEQQPRVAKQRAAEAHRIFDENVGQIE